MVEVIKRIDLCYSNASVILTPVQNDAGSRFLIASLTSEGEPYTIPEGCTVQLAVRKPDGTKTLTAASVKDNTVVCELTNQSLAVKGIADAQIIIYNGLAVLKTPPFKLNTFEQIVSDDTIVSTDEFTALSEIMKNYQEISAEVAKKLNKSGGVMSGNIDMAGNKIENIALPVADNDAASKKYVDEKTENSERLIYDNTLTEPVSSILITNDMDGNVFSVKNITIYVTIPASPDLNALGYLAFQLTLDYQSAKTTLSTNITRIAGGTEGSYHRVMLKLTAEDDRWNCISATTTNQKSSLYLLKAAPDMMGFIGVYSKIPYYSAKGIYLGCSTSGSELPIGTRIEVYGK